LWEQQYITFTGSQLYEHITTEQRNKVEKILNNNEFCKYKRALDLLHKYARENVLHVKKQRKEFIESASIRAPKHVYGIPKTLQTFVKERPRLVVVGDHAVGKTSLLYVGYS
jgi:polynucleotide 5'-kinase involved in rRNA processing